MHVHSLGYRTDLIFPAFDGEILETLVMVADYDGPPARLYQSVGFQPTEVQVGLEWWQDDDHPS